MNCHMIYNGACVWSGHVVLFFDVSLGYNESELAMIYCQLYGWYIVRVLSVVTDLSHTHTHTHTRINI